MLLRLELETCTKQRALARTAGACRRDQTGTDPSAQSAGRNLLGDQPLRQSKRGTRSDAAQGIAGSFTGHIGSTHASVKRLELPVMRRVWRDLGERQGR